MIDKMALFIDLRSLGAQKTLAEVESALAQKEITRSSLAKQKRSRYRIEIWDRVSPINGVPADKIISSRDDLPPGGEVYLIYRDDKLLYFQPHSPFEGGLRPMSKEEISQIAEDHVNQMISEEIDQEFYNEVLVDLLSETN